MAQTVAPMQMTFSIVERGKGQTVIEHFRKYKITHHIRLAGRGTAASHLLDALGFGTSERDIILSVAPKDTVNQVMHYLKDDERPQMNARGIAFSMNLTGMTAYLAVALSLAEKIEAESEEPIVEQKNHHCLIVVSVNQGYTDAVMDTARAAGARGGTVLRGRWVGAGEIEKFVGITLQEEKEVLLIVTTTDTRNAVMERINQMHGLKSESQSMVFSLPIDCVARLD